MGTYMPMVLKGGMNDLRFWKVANIPVPSLEFWVTPLRSLINYGDNSNIGHKTKGEGFHLKSAGCYLIIFTSHFSDAMNKKVALYIINYLIVIIQEHNKSTFVTSIRKAQMVELMDVHQCSNDF